MKKLVIFLISLVAVAASSAFAQQNIVISPQSIVVNPLPEFSVEVYVDKDTSGNSSPSYNIGDPITISTKVSADAYVYLFNVRSSGEIVQILPNQYDPQGQNNFVRAGETKTFPPSGARYRFNVDGPTGLDKVIAVASKTALDVAQLASFQNDPNFASSNMGEQDFARTLSIIVTPLPQASWVTDTVLFYVVNNSQPPAPVYGTVSVTSSPSGAAVYIDNNFRGYTPISFGENTGSHTIKLDLNGYQSYQQSINVQGGSTVQVSANLSPVVPVVRTGTVTFNSNPQGAEVYVNGSYVGRTPTGPISYNAGTYSASYRLSGYQDGSVSFNVSANSNQTVNISLAPNRPPQGTVSFDSNPRGASVYVNNNLVGTTPVSATYDAGTYQARFSYPGYADAVVSFSVSGGSSQTVSSSLTAAQGTLIVRANINDARIFVNGVDYGTMSTGVGRIRELPAGTHQLTVVAEGYNTLVQDIVITAGQTNDLRVTLTRR